jgi:hypothetical protein
LLAALLVAVPHFARAAELRPNEREFVEFEMTIISIAINCLGYLEAVLPKWAAAAEVRPEVIEAMHQVLQVASGAQSPRSNLELITAVHPIVFNTLRDMRDTLKKDGACDLLGREAVKHGFLRHD